MFKNVSCISLNKAGGESQVTDSLQNQMRIHRRWSALFATRGVRKTSALISLAPLASDASTKPSWVYIASAFGVYHVHDVSSVQCLSLSLVSRPTKNHVR